MSWLYSRALVGECLEQQHVGYESSALLSQIGSADVYWCSDKTSEPCQLSRYGMTCELLTAQRGGALLRWYREGFRVNPSAVDHEDEGLPRIYGLR